MMLKKWVLLLLLAFSISAGVTYAAAMVDVNVATQEELQTVKGIGEKTAEAIIEYRKENGAFTTIEDLVNVKGIGDKKLSKISEQLTVIKPE